MRNSQETNSGAHGGAVHIVKTYIGEVLEKCQECELEWFAMVLHTDIALEYVPPKLFLFSIKVQEGL